MLMASSIKRISLKSGNRKKQEILLRSLYENGTPSEIVLLAVLNLLEKSRLVKVQHRNFIRQMAKLILDFLAKCVCTGNVSE